MKKRAVGYVRVSTKDQEKNTSLEDQSEAVEKYAEENGWNLIYIYSDAKSGADMY